MSNHCTDAGGSLSGRCINSVTDRQLKARNQADIGDNTTSDIFHRKKERFETACRANR